MAFTSIDFDATASTSDATLLLAGNDDDYGGFIIDPLELPSDPSAFVCRLRQSLSYWKSQGKTWIWLKLFRKDGNLVFPALQEGFRYHHAEKEYVMLTLLIPATPPIVPADGSHRVGLGAIVINDQNEVLVVQETTGPTQGSVVWKLPTGVLVQGEDIKDGVEREVEVKTGVKAEFIELLGVRQSHDVAFGKSDLFFLCKLRPLSSEITLLDSKIAAAQWMSLDEYISQNVNIESGLLTRFGDIATASLKNKYKGFGPKLLAVGFRKKGAYFYHNVQDINKYLEQKNRKISWVYVLIFLALCLCIYVGYPCKLIPLFSRNVPSAAVHVNILR